MNLVFTLLIFQERTPPNKATNTSALICQNSFNVPAMSSREIATLTGKKHYHIMRDIDVMTEQLEIDVSKFAHIYLDSMNRQQTEYLLGKDTCLCLVAGYNAKLRYDFVENKDYISLPKKRKRKNQ